VEDFQFITEKVLTRRKMLCKHFLSARRWSSAL